MSSGTAASGGSLVAPMRAVQAVQTALAAEHAALWAYGVLGPRAGENDDLAEASFDAHRLGRDRLVGWLTRRHHRPVPARPGYRLPFPVRDAEDAAALARRLEDGCGNAYAAVVAASEPGELRDLAIDRLIDCATRRVKWGGQPMPFPGHP